ncbi:aminopeptidase P family protein [Candidatus Daviesbacteria bacterium]|nr:aminopeptidase P family protein [Candidatus Daviesbacteria bacterium]
MFNSRVQEVKKKILTEKIDAILISSVSNIVYLTGFTNFSKDEREAYLLIGKDFQYIVTDGRYTEAVKRQVSNFTLFERGHKNKTEDLLKSLTGKIQTLGIEGHNLSYLEYRFFKKHIKKLKHINLEIHRSIKTEDEIKKIEQACKLGDKAFEYILKKIKPGVTEKEIAFELEYFVKKAGADLSFPSIVACSKNSSIPHHQTGNTRLEERRGQFVLLDFGVKLENYCSDMTRTVFFGKPTQQQRRIYETVLAAQQKVIDYITESLKSGKPVKAVSADKAARDYIISKGYPSIPHSLGHGIGLEVHEHPSLSPKSKEILKEGMVFSIEPGIYIEDFGGVRIEDLFVLKKGGLQQLTSASKAIISL